MEPEQLVETWRGPLTGLHAGWGASWADAAELAQDTLVEAYLGRSRFGGDAGDPNAVGAWLRGIARNLYRSSARRRASRREEGLEGVGGAAGAACVGGLGRGEGPDRQPEDARLEALRGAMAQLREKHRVVLYMHYLEETSVAEVAGLLGLTAKAVEGRLHQGRKALRRLMEARGTA